MEKWNGKKKVVTFSFDDGVQQDERLIKLLDKYHVKASFNLNSGTFGTLLYDENNGHPVDRRKINASKVKELYKNHEVCVHTIVHPNLTELDEDAIIYQVEQDRINLSNIVGYNVQGMAYPCGGVNNDERVAKIIKENTGIKFARTITSSLNFDLQENLYQFNPTVYWIHKEDLFRLAKEFISLKTDKPQIFYIWGHSYEADYGYISWEEFEEFLKLISDKEDIYYCSNSEALL